MLAFWTGGKTLQTNKLHNNVTDSSSKNPEVTIDQAPTSQIWTYQIRAFLSLLVHQILVILKNGLSEMKF